MATTIDATTLKSAQDPLKLPVLPQDNGIMSQNAIQSALGNVSDLTSQVTAQENALKGDGNMYLQLQNQINGLDTQRAQMESQANIQQQKQDVLNASNQLNTLATQAKVVPLAGQQEAIGRGRTEAGQAPLDAANLRNNAIQALTISADLAAKQGNLALAQSNIDKTIELKNQALTNDLNLRKQSYEMNKDALERVDKKRADALGYAIKKQETELAEKKKNETEIANMITEAIPNAPPDVIARARKLQEGGASKLVVAQELGVYGGDYLLREKIKAEIRNKDADTAKTRRVGTGVSVGGVSGASSTAKDWVTQFNSGLLSAEEIYTKIGSSKESTPVKNEVAKLIAAQGGKRVYGKDDAAVQAINSQIKNVDDLLNGDVGSIVGLVQGGLGVSPDRWNTYKQDALAIAKNLTSNQTLQALADAKSKGITFGALSEKELSTVAESASRIAAKLKTAKDSDGNVMVTGFTGSESEFRKDLKEVKEGLEKSIGNKTQTTQKQEDNIADDIMNANTSVRQSISNSGYNVFQQ